MGKLQRNWRERHCGVLTRGGLRFFCRLPWCSVCGPWRARLFADHACAVAKEAGVLARLTRVEVDVPEGVNGFRRCMKAFRNACHRRGAQQKAWSRIAAWMALGGDSIARGIIHFPGMHVVTVCEVLDRLGWRVLPFGPAASPGEVGDWVRAAVLRSGEIDEDAMREAVVAAGGFRALLARKGW